MRSRSSPPRSLAERSECSELARPRQVKSGWGSARRPAGPILPEQRPSPTTRSRTTANVDGYTQPARRTSARASGVIEPRLATRVDSAHSSTTRSSPKPRTQRGPSVSPKDSPRLERGDDDSDRVVGAAIRSASKSTHATSGSTSEALAPLCLRIESSRAAPVSVPKIRDWEVEGSQSGSRLVNPRFAGRSRDDRLPADRDLRCGKRAPTPDSTSPPETREAPTAA
jgi:hypothetical protein